MKIFILEDDTARIVQFRQALIGHTVTVADSVRSAQIMWDPPYDVVLLDHDLGGRVYVNSVEENTGFQFARFLTEPTPFAAIKDAYIIVHSWNPDGAKAMVKQLQDHYDLVLRKEFGPTLLTWLENLRDAL